MAVFSDSTICGGAT